MPKKSLRQIRKRLAEVCADEEFPRRSAFMIEGPDGMGLTVPLDLLGDWVEKLEMLGLGTMEISGYRVGLKISKE